MNKITLIWLGILTGAQVFTLRIVWLLMDDVNRLIAIAELVNEALIRLQP